MMLLSVDMNSSVGWQELNTEQACCQNLLGKQLHEKPFSKLPKSLNTTKPCKTFSQVMATHFNTELSAVHFPMWLAGLFLRI